MGSLNPPGWGTVHPQDYDAAESMLQHSRLARSHHPSKGANGYPPSTTPTYTSQPSGTQLPPIGINIPPRTNFTAPSSALGRPEQEIPFDSPYDNNHDSLRSHHSRTQQCDPTRSTDNHFRTSTATQSHQEQRRNSLGFLHAASPSDNRGADGPQSRSWTHSSSNEPVSRKKKIKEDPEGRPEWADQKTKAGKDRKRLPLACISCRRKKIRCSGGKPSCKHCTRSQMPCVYITTTTRKAASRTDYIGMLDRRMKRMEERVMKMIPNTKLSGPSAITRSIVRPSATNHKQNSKKRTAAEMIGFHAGRSADPRPSVITKEHVNETQDSRLIMEGAEHLPSMELQEHLSEIFFDYLHGQSYYLMHKPSYMRKLREGSLLPVLVLGVCAVAARFANHREVDSEPAFLRGEQWASPARDIVLKRFDVPDLGILTVTVLLGLHEFGTCQGGRSWMFAGMATRMAHALQLHREMDHDPLGRKNGEQGEPRFIDCEVRRRTMWACFLMDRFTASGTDRPMFSDEDDIKIQLPIKESYFNREIAGPTETLKGGMTVSTNVFTDNAAIAKGNMGVAAYIVRIIALWGRVIKYWNWGGRANDIRPMWAPYSNFSRLRKEADDLEASLPPSLVDNPENLDNHAAEKMGNQFLFLHAALCQLLLYHNRFAMSAAPTDDGGDMPDAFLTEAVLIALDAANRISSTIEKAMKYHAVAPFISYCAFLSSSAHYWSRYHGDEINKSMADRNIATNAQYLDQMKNYWGVVQFQIDELNDIHRRLEDDFKRGKRRMTATGQSPVLHYGDWFDKCPGGVPKMDHQPNRPLTSEGPVEDCTPDPYNGEHKPTQSIKMHKTPKFDPRANKRPLGSETSGEYSYQTEDMSMPISAPQTPLHFHANQHMYHGPNQIPSHVYAYPSQANTSLLPQLDRQLVYGAYAGTDPNASTSTLVLNGITNGMAGGYTYNSLGGHEVWEANPQVALPQQEVILDAGSAGVPYMGDSSAWFMPFNMNAGDLDGELWCT